MYARWAPQPRRVRAKISQQLEAEGIPDGLKAAEVAFITAVRRHDSPWPVDTGLSKRSFTFLSSRKTRRRVLHNLSGYADHVERRTGALAQILAWARDDITRATDTAIQKWLDV